MTRLSIQARHDLAADSQNYRWMLHLVRHSRLMRRLPDRPLRR